MITSQTSSTTTDTKIPCSVNNIILVPVKYQSDDTKIPCVNDNINNFHAITCPNNYGNTILSKKLSGIWD